MISLVGKGIPRWVGLATLFSATGITPIAGVPYRPILIINELVGPKLSRHHRNVPLVEHGPMGSLRLPNDTDFDFRRAEASVAPPVPRSSTPSYYDVARRHSGSR